MTTQTSTSATRRWFRALPRSRRWPAARHQHVLDGGNIYVLPSPAGWFLCATLLVLLLASINFQLNLGYALTFLIAGSALASLWLGHRNLRGLQLQLDALPPVFQGERAHIPVLLQIRHGRHSRHGLSLALDRLHGPLAWAHTDVATGQTARVELGSVPHMRGWHQVPRILMESRFPLGVFRLWSYWQPDDRVLVYPAPETPMPPVRFGQANAHGSAPMQHSGSSEFDGVRSYQRGDAMRQVVWKKAATALASGSGELVVRDSAAAPTRTLWLDARATGLLDPEAQIARLTAWVLQAHAQQWHWGLVLPSGRRMGPAGGGAHLHACLAALAVDGHPAAMPAPAIPTASAATR